MESKKDYISKFLDWNTWDDGDFEGWQSGVVLTALIQWYNQFRCSIGEKKRNIVPMGDFLKLEEGKQKISNGCAIRQSVMSFSDEEVDLGMMGDFSENDPYARFDTADSGFNNDKIYAISMSCADVTNWIMTHFGGEPSTIVKWIESAGLLDEVYEDAVQFVENHAYAKKIWNDKNK